MPEFSSLCSPLVVLAAMMICAGLTMALRPLLARYALAEPNSRSSHRAPTPQGGGIAILMATICVSSVAVWAVPELGSMDQLVVVFGASTLLAVIGAADDIRPLGAAPRLLLHAIAVAIAILALPPELRTFPQLPWWLERSLLLLAGIWFVNLVNFMDGIDWMTVCEVVPITVGLVLIGSLGGLRAYGVLVALALLGATLGFAPFNRPVARLFLGDVGSLPIGLLVGWLLILVAGSGHLAAAILLPLYYLADATITLLRRLSRGERVWQAHRTHFYQRATDHGFEVQAVVGRVFAVNIGLATLATLSVLVPSTFTSLGALAVGGMLVAWLLIRFSGAP
jgi:UDP-N-acetylmuramyl pentapeptide phosphotransferase/UDP-N-acetylglucosamine-1-phosphate transferase